MHVKKSLFLSLPALMLLTACKLDSGSTEASLPAPLPSGSTTTTVSTATQTTATAASTTLTVPVETSTALLALSGGAPVTVAFSQNDASKQSAIGLAALGSAGAGNITTATWVINASRVGGARVEEAPGAIQTEAAANGAAVSYQFNISLAPGSSRVYRGVVSTDGGLTWTQVTVVRNGDIARVIGSANGLPVWLMVQEIWSSTGGN